jgi:hypothetical protein
VEIHGDNFEQVKQILQTHNFKQQIIRTMGHISHIVGSK